MNRSKAKGTKFESAIVATLNAAGLRHVERRTLAGVNDKGDIAGLPGIVVEAKAVADYDLPGWLREAAVERENAGAWLGVVWMKLRGRTDPAECAVIMRGDQFVTLLQVLEKAGVLK